MRKQRSRMWLIVPNALSLLRVVLGAAFPWIPPDWRLAAFLVAGGSDFLDGAASRMLRASSRTGRMLDPVCDKAFAAGVVVTLLIEGTLQPWELALLAPRELAVFVGVAWLLAVRDWAALRRLPPSWLGKLTSGAQFLYIISLLVAYPHPAFLAVPAASSTLAGLHYSWQFLRRRQQTAPQTPLG